MVDVTDIAMPHLPAGRVALVLPALSEAEGNPTLQFMAFWWLVGGAAPRQIVLK